VKDINLIILGVIKLSDLWWGGQFNSSDSFGGSVARARLANESIIKLTQSSYIGFKGLSLRIAAPKNAQSNAITFTVN